MVTAIWVFGAPLCHADGLAAVEAAGLQRTHVLLGQVGLAGIATGCHELLALSGGGGDTIRVRRGIQSVWENQGQIQLTKPL